MAEFIHITLYKAKVDHCLLNGYLHAIYKKIVLRDVTVKDISLRDVYSSRTKDTGIIKY